KAAKSTGSEIEALEVSADDKYMQEMSQILVEGTRCLTLSFASLKGDPVEASQQAVLARKSENRFTKVYRQAMRNLFKLDDCKQILRVREVYRQMLQAAERIDVVREKLSHVVVKSPSPLAVRCRLRPANDCGNFCNLPACRLFVEWLGDWFVVRRRSIGGSVFVGIHCQRSLRLLVQRLHNWCRI